jgi:hypothetical protein
MGNIKANSIFNPDETKHPPPANTSEFADRDGELEQFIRRKWVMGRFKAGHQTSEFYGMESAPRTTLGPTYESPRSRPSLNPELSDIVVPRNKSTPLPDVPSVHPSDGSLMIGKPRFNHGSSSRPRPVPTFRNLGPGSNANSSSFGGRSATRSMVDESWNDLLVVSNASDLGEGSSSAVRGREHRLRGSSTAQPSRALLHPVATGDLSYTQQNLKDDKIPQPSSFGDLLQLGDHGPISTSLNPFSVAQPSQNHSDAAKSRQIKPEYTYNNTIIDPQFPTLENGMPSQAHLNSSSPQYPLTSGPYQQTHGMQSHNMCPPQQDIMTGQYSFLQPYQREARYSAFQQDAPGFNPVYNMASGTGGPNFQANGLTPEQNFFRSGY